MDFDQSPISRRHALKAAAGLTAGLALGPRSLWAEDGASGRRLLSVGPITKPIPSSGEQLPVIGAGTFRGWEQPEKARAFLRELVRAGGKVVYPDVHESAFASHANVKAGVTELGIRDKLFLLAMPRGQETLAQVTQRLGTIDAGMASLTTTAERFEKLKQAKAAKQIRYVGYFILSNTSLSEAEAKRLKEGADFVFLSTFSYSILQREAEQQLLPFAKDNGIAVILGAPFGGGGRFFTKAGQRPLPPWAAELGIKSWAQFALKYLVSQPAVVCALPDTSKMEHFVDNLGAAQGELADEPTRRKMAAILDSM